MRNIIKNHWTAQVILIYWKRYRYLFRLICFFELRKYVKYLLKLGYHHWSTTLLHTTNFFIPIFLLKNSGWFLTKTLFTMSWLHSGRNQVTQDSYHLYSQVFLIIYSWLLKLFRDKIIISKWGSFENRLLQSGASIFSKWDRGSYFKVGHCLFQSRVKVISKLYYAAIF